MSALVEKNETKRKRKSTQESLKRKSTVRITATDSNSPPGLNGDDDSDGEIIFVGTFPADTKGNHSTPKDNDVGRNETTFNMSLRSHEKQPSEASIAPRKSKSPKSEAIVTSKQEDSDDECMIVEEARKNVPVATQDMDDGDDDCMVVNPNEVAKVSQRDKSFKCKSCSQAFVTEKGLETHIAQSHKTDISVSDQLCDQDFGIPSTDVITYICRTCCVAFECHARFIVHQKNHLARGKFFHCDYCSGTQVCPKDLDRHHDRHKDPNIAEKFKYICVHCPSPISFLQEAQFIFHMNVVHSAPIYTFCKNCCAGSVNGCAIYAHIKEGKCRKPMIPNFSMMGFTAATDLKLEPKDIRSHIMNLKSNPNNFIRLSTCNHRTFIRFGTVFTSCPDDTKGACYGIVNSHRWQAVKSAKEAAGLVDENFFAKQKIIQSNPSKDDDMFVLLSRAYEVFVKMVQQNKALTAQLANINSKKGMLGKIAATKTRVCVFCCQQTSSDVCVFGSMFHAQRVFWQIANIPLFKEKNLSSTIFTKFCNNLAEVIKQQSLIPDTACLPFCRKHFEDWMIGQNRILNSMSYIRIESDEELASILK